MLSQINYNSTQREQKSRTSDFSLFALMFVAAAVIIAVYWPVLGYNFVKYDDDTYVTNNYYVNTGISWRNIRWAFTSGYASNWHPVTWLSHMLDCQIFGVKAGAHHFVNVLFHIANTLLLFVVLKKMMATFWPSAFVAAAFALHPLHVESVAWIAERKDVLSTFFWLLTMWAYISYCDNPKAPAYLLALAFFIIGLMAKPMLVTLPFVLLLLDYWPLKRMELGNKVGNSKSILQLLIEKIPFLILSVIASVVTFIVQRSGGAMHTMESFSLKSRLGNAIVSYVVYIAKMFWPSKLAVLYPHPGNSLSMIAVIVCGLLLLVISFCFIYLAGRCKYLIVGWLWYIGTLVPVIGLVQVGVQARADRYTYIPLIGLFIIVAWGVWDLFARFPYRRIFLPVLAITVLSIAAILTSRQVKYWENSLKLFERTLDVTGDNFPIHSNYANVLSDMGKLEKAVEHFNKSLKLKPDSPQVHNNLGNTLRKLDRIDEAIEHYKKAIEFKPGFSQAHYNLAIALTKQGKIDQAIKQYSKAVRFDPEDVDALCNLGFLLAGKSKFDEAIEFYKRAIELQPNNTIAHGRLGLALAQTDNLDEAIKEFRIVLEARPNDFEMHCNLGILLQRQGKIDEAIAEYRRTLQINPNYKTAREQLDAALSKQENR